MSDVTKIEMIGVILSVVVENPYFICEILDRLTKKELRKMFLNASYFQRKLDEGESK